MLVLGEIADRRETASQRKYHCTGNGQVVTQSLTRLSKCMMKVGWGRKGFRKVPASVNNVEWKGNAEEEQSENRGGWFRVSGQRRGDCQASLVK